MRGLIKLAILCAVWLPGAFGQDSPGNVVASVGYLYPAPVTVAPGQVVTVFVAGSIQGDVTATVHQLTDHPAPVLAVVPAPDCSITPQQPCSATTAVTIQIPFEILPSCFFCATPANFYTQLFISVNGVAGPPFDLTPLADRVHILTSCDTLVGGSGFLPYNGLPCSPLITHADGSLVSALNPARGAEEIVAWAVGMGATTPALPTGQAATMAAATNQTFVLDFNFRPNALATKPIVSLPQIVPQFAGLAVGYVGLYQVNFIVPQPPAQMAACGDAVQTNLTISLGAQYSFDGVGICVEP